ncbi:MAG TPA: NAD(P)H-dependent oxidoreductase [Bacteroidetes bacterium]|nr:NAD(P)H-dependent oxidoreductase [Bacteroidota bacterium]
MSNFLNTLRTRHAVKNFDFSKKVLNENIEIIKESIRLSPSSYNLMPCRVIDVQDKGVRRKLKAASYNQGQITEASHLFVFCSLNTLSQDYIQKINHIREDIEGKEKDFYKGYVEFLQAIVGGKSKDDIMHWNAKQTYIALGFAMMACASLSIDSCPIEGFDAEKYSQILKLADKGLTPNVVLAVGYAQDEENLHRSPKVRLDTSDFFLDI